MVGGERGSVAWGTTPDDHPPTHNPITAHLGEKRMNDGEKSEGMRTKKDKVI